MASDPLKFKAPHIPAQECWARADAFREELWPSGDFPVDVLAIAEFGLGLEMRVVDGLKSLRDIDALLGLDFKTIAVDTDQYMESRFHCRMRYSVAHELGHFVLHRQAASVFPKEELALRAFYDKIPEKEYSFLEFHANEFAGALLVPASELTHQVTQWLQRSDVASLADEGPRVEATAWLARYFAVSTEVIEKRLARVGLDR